MSKNDEPFLLSAKEEISETPMGKILEEKNEPISIDISDSQMKEIWEEANVKGENKTGEKTGLAVFEVPETETQEIKPETKEKTLKEAIDKLLKIGTTFQYHR